MALLQPHDKNDAYVPHNGNYIGYIGKGNALFAELLCFERSGQNSGRSIVEQINAKYPAFRFALPEGVREGECQVGDVRLVGINENYIDSIRDKKIRENLRTWYNNSDIKSVLKKQRNSMFQKLFDIKIVVNSGQAVVKHIKMIPALYKIKFGSKPWTGTINGQSYGKIDEDNSLFLVYGSSILPICKQNHIIDRQNNYKITLANNVITHEGKDVDLYDYYNDVYTTTPKRISMKFNDGNEPLVLQVLKERQGSGDVIYIDLPSHLDAYCNDSLMTATSYPGQGNRWFYRMDSCENSVRIIVSNSQRHDKISEFYVFRKNLMNRLSYSIATNKGKQRMKINDRYTDDFTKQIIHVFDSKMNGKSPKVVNLTIDPALSKMLEKEIEEYVNNHLNGKRLRIRENIEMSVAVISSATGEVLAASSYSTQKVNPLLKLERRNPNTQRRFIGSSFKPLMTLATVLMYDNLLDMRLSSNMWRVDTTYQNKKGKTCHDMKILGYPVRGVSSSIRGDFIDTLNMQTYISKSNDAYPIILAMYGFSEPNNNRLPTNSINLRWGGFPSLLKASDENTWIAKKEEYSIDDGKFAPMLDALYNISSSDVNVKNKEDKEDSPELYVWRLYNRNKFDDSDSISFPDISPELTNMNYDSWYRPRENFRGKVISWVLGQGDNSWCPLKLTEAWARMTTKNPVRLTFIKNDAETYDKTLPQIIQERDASSKPLRWTANTPVDTVWNNFLRMFRKAQTYGSLLSPMHNKAIAIGNNLVVLGKTGTPDEFTSNDNGTADSAMPNDMQYDLGLYTFSLMTRSQFNRIVNGGADGGNTNAGLSVVVRIVHTYKKENGTVFSNSNKIESKHARNFFSRDNSRVLEKTLFYTTKLFH